MHETPIRYLVIDDNALFRGGLRDELAAFADLELVGEAGSGALALEQARVHQPQVVLLDGSLAGMSAVETAQALRVEIPAPAVCLLTMAETPQQLCAALAAGVRGLLPKASTIACVHSALLALAQGLPVIAPSLAIRFLATCYGCCPAPTTSGGAFDALTPHEQALVYGVAQDWTTQQLAAGCGSPLGTVKHQLQRLLAKLGLQDRQALAAFAGELGLRTPVAA